MQTFLDRINSHPRAALLTAGIGVFGVSAIIILLMVLNLQNTINTPVVTPEEQKMVLSEVIKNNPKELLNNSNTNVSGGASGQSSEQVVAPSQPSVAPDITEYNYRVTKVTYVNGPMAGSCTSFSYYGGFGGPSNLSNQVSEYFEYYERYLTLSKYQTKEENNLSYFSINSYGRDINENIAYLQGKYAVQSVYAPYQSFDNLNSVQTVTSYPEYTPSDLISMYFGANAQIIRTEVDSAGRKYYYIESSYTSYCDPEYSENLVTNDQPPVQRTIYSVFKVNASTFAIEEVKKYLDVVKDQNLLSTSTTQVSRSMVTKTQVEGQFKLADNVSVKVNDFRNVSYSWDAVSDYNKKVDYLAQKGYSLLLPNEYSMLSALYVREYTDSINVYANNYYSDREFYPEGAWGDTLYKRYNPVSNIAYSLSLTLPYNQYFSISLYKPGQNIEDLQTSLLSGKATSKKIEDVKLAINGQQVSAKKISKILTYYYPTSYSVSYPSSFPTSYGSDYYTNQNINYLVEIDGSIYNISYYISQSNSVDLESLNYTKYGLSDLQNINSAKDRLIQMANAYAIFWGYPLSYTASYPVSY